MLFLNSRRHTTAISGRRLHDRSYTQKVGHTCIIFGCLSIITGLIVIIIGVISETNRTTYIGISIVILGVVLFLITLICFYAKLNICYNNWAYRSRVLPTNNIETPQPASATVITLSSFVGSPAMTQKSQFIIPLEPPTPLTIVSEVEIHKVIDS